MKTIQNYLLIVIALFYSTFFIAGCTTDNFNEFMYNTGQMDACMQSNENHAYEGAEDLDCMGKLKGADMSYDEYKTLSKEVH